jgi:hypothetical protein
MSTVVVRYRTQPDRSDENQRLVEEVFAELARSQPAGLRYATLRVADGTFVHIAQLETEANPLTETTAFAEFLDGIAERCLPGQGPDAQPATVVGAYGFTDLAD